MASLFAGDEGDTRDNRYLGYFTTHWKRLRGEKADPMDYDDSAVERIVDLNDLQDSAVRPGQRLVVPQPEPVAP